MAALAWAASCARLRRGHADGNARALFQLGLQGYFLVFQLGQGTEQRGGVAMVLYGAGDVADLRAQL